MKHYFIILISSAITLYASEENQKNIRAGFELIKSLNDYRIKSGNILNKITDETISVDTAKMTLLEDLLCVFEFIANNKPSEVRQDLVKSIPRCLFDIYAEIYLNEVAYELEQESINIPMLRNRFRALERIESHSKLATKDRSFFIRDENVEKAYRLHSKCFALYLKNLEK